MKNKEHWKIPDRFFYSKYGANANQYTAEKNSVLEKLRIGLQHFYTPLSKIFDHCAARGSKPLTKQGMKRRCKNFVLSMQHIPKRVFIFCQKVKQWKLFDVNLRHFLCLCVRAYYTVLVSYNFDSDSISVLKCKEKLDKWFICLISIIF